MVSKLNDGWSVRGSLVVNHRDHLEVASFIWRSKGTMAWDTHAKVKERL
jgi:hypothetical protein